MTESQTTSRDPNRTHFFEVKTTIRVKILSDKKTFLPEEDTSRKRHLMLVGGHGDKTGSVSSFELRKKKCGEIATFHSDIPSSSRDEGSHRERVGIFSWKELKKRGRPSPTEQVSCLCILYTQPSSAPLSSLYRIREPSARYLGFPLHPDTTLFYSPGKP